MKLQIQNLKPNVKQMLKASFVQITTALEWLLIDARLCAGSEDLDRELNSAGRTAHMRTWEYRNDGF